VGNPKDNTDPMRNLQKKHYYNPNLLDFPQDKPLLCMGIEEEQYSNQPEI